MILEKPSNDNGWFSGLIIGNKLNLPAVNLVTDTTTANKIVYARLITPGSDMTKLKKNPSKGYSADTCHHLWIVNWVIKKEGMAHAWAVWPKDPYKAEKRDLQARILLKASLSWPLGRSLW